MTVKQMFAAVIIFAVGSTYAETETIGFWTFDGSTEIDTTKQEGSPSGNGVPQRTNTWFPNQVPGGELTMFLQKGTWQGYNIGAAKYIDEVPAGNLFSDTALTNRLCALTKSIRLGAGATGSYCTGYGLTIPNFMEVVGTNESFTVEVLMRVYSQSQEDGSYSKLGGSPVIGIGRKADTMSDDQDAAVILRGYSGTYVGIYAYDPSETVANAYNTFSATHGGTPDRLSGKSVLAGDVWRTVTLCWNAKTRKLTYRSDYMDAIYVAEDKVNNLIEFGTNSIFRIGGVWKDRNGALSYVLGTVDVAAVRVKRGLASWYEDMTPWNEQTPRNLGHWRFEDANGAIANKVMPNLFATNLSFVSCVNRRTSSNWYDTAPLTSGSFTNEVWAPYVKTASRTPKRLPNDSAFSSYVNGVNTTPQLRIMNLPMYLIDDFTLEFVFLTTTANYNDTYPQPAICLMRAPEDTSSYFYVANMQSQMHVGYRGEGDSPTVLYCGNVGFTRLVWQHVAVVRDRAAGTVKLYRNGELKNTKALPADARVWCGDATNYAYTQLMSNSRNGWESDYKGLVDEIRFTRAALEPKDFLRPKQQDSNGIAIMVR